MQTTFKNKEGKTFAPAHFAVFHKKGGKTFKSVQDQIDILDADNYEGIIKIELYENGTENLAPIMIDEVRIKL